MLKTPNYSLQAEHFLTNSKASLAAYQEAIATAQEVLLEYFATQTQPYSGATPKQLVAAISGSQICFESGQELRNILNNFGKTILNNSVVVSHPKCVAHLHCPPLIPALAAEVLISASNQSMDSWDQSPAATILEQQLVNWLCNLFGYDAGADGILVVRQTNVGLVE